MNDPFIYSDTAAASELQNIGVNSLTHSMVDHYLVAKIEYIPSFEEKIESSDEDFSLFDKETYVIAIDLSGLEKIHIWPPSPIIEESAIKKFDQNNTIETYS